MSTNRMFEKMKEKLKKNNEQQKQDAGKTDDVFSVRNLVIGFIIFCFSLVFMIVAFVNGELREQNSDKDKTAMALVYEEFTPEEEKVEGTDITFSAFFPYDLNGDGIVDHVKGTCKEIGNEVPLYMQLNVGGEGTLKDAKIQINGQNFYLNANFVGEELKQYYYSENLKEVEFNPIQSSGKVINLRGTVSAGDSKDRLAALKNNFNNYSRDDNEIILTGTYVAADGTEKQIEKTTRLTVDWYGITEPSVDIWKGNTSDPSIDEANGKMSIEVDISVAETKGQLLLAQNNVEVIIPQLNGYDPIADGVKLKSANASFEYDSQTRTGLITKAAQADSDGNITDGLLRSSDYKIEITYPIEAWNAIREDEMATISVTVKAKYIGFNNAKVDAFLYVSEDKEATIVRNLRRGSGDGATAWVNIGTWVTDPEERFVVEKKKPLNWYNGAGTDENDIYVVEWCVYTGKSENSVDSRMRLTDKAVLQGVQHHSDSFITSDSQRISMDNVVKNVGIAFSGDIWGDYIFSEDEEPYINVFDDDTGELIHKFTKDDWDDYAPYGRYFIFENPVQHIRVETSKILKNHRFRVYTVKKIDDKVLTETYSKAEFDELKYIETGLDVTFTDRETSNGIEDIHIKSCIQQAKYEAPYSLAKIVGSKSVIPAQVTENNFKITIEASKKGYNLSQCGWIDGSFLVKLPDEILEAKINDVTIDNSKVEIVSTELIENENGKFVKINTRNRSKYEEGYNITIDIDLTADPRTTTVDGEMKLYASNTTGVDYYTTVKDEYDVNDNGNVDELVNYSTARLGFTAVNGLITTQTISNFDSKGSYAVSPQIADVEPIYGSESATGEATIGVQIRNNYSTTISEVVLMGKIPFEGNKDAVTNNELGSKFTVEMKNTGIKVPEELEGRVAVYYSENGDATKDLSDASNGWKTADQITDWSNIRTYLIDFQDVIMNVKDNYVFEYVVIMPEFKKELIDQVSYSHHVVYFYEDIPEGKMPTTVDPSKVGMRIAEKFNLELTKFQTGTDKVVPDAKYAVTEINADGSEGNSKSAVTKADGKLLISGLYVGRKYVIRETITPEDYELNNDATEILGEIDDNGNLTIKKLVGNAEIEKTEDYKVFVKVYDEPRVRLRLQKKEYGTENTIKGVQYRISGGNLLEGGVIKTTQDNGLIDLSGLSLNTEYTIQEVKADGYYLASPIKFVISRNGDTYSLDLREGVVKNSQIVFVDELPVVSLELENEKIPTYNLDITKIKRVTHVEESDIKQGEEEIVYLQGAKFKLLKDEKEIAIFESDENGKIVINNLYQYVDGKDFNATYTLREIVAPVGYSKIKDIQFKVQRINGELQFIVEEGNDKEYTVEGDTIKIILEDSPSFKLIKKDGETGELLANTKFAVYNIENGEVPAVNSKGEIIGEKETINGVEYYLVTTDQYGELTLDLPEGLYKAVEMVASDDKYDINNAVYYFGIGGTLETKEKLTFKNYQRNKAL